MSLAITCKPKLNASSSAIGKPRATTAARIFRRGRTVPAVRAPSESGEHDIRALLRSRGFNEFVKVGGEEHYDVHARRGRERH
jgi:hypothetical protein